MTSRVHQQVIDALMVFILPFSVMPGIWNILGEAGRILGECGCDVFRGC